MLMLIFTTLWLAACGAAAFRLWFRRPGDRRPEQHFYMAALALLAMAPLTSWLVEVFTPITHYWTGSGQAIGAVLMAAFGVSYERHRRRGDAAASPHSFREKSALLMFVTLLVLTVGASVILVQSGTEALASIVVSAIFLLVVMSIAGHLVIALTHYPLYEIDAPADERDSDVELHSIRNSYYVLVAGIWVIPVMAIAALPGIQVAMACGVLILAAELVYYGSMVRYYRAGYA